MNISEALRTGQGITLSEALSMGGLTTGMGLTIVFAVLVILMLVLMLFKVIFYKEDKDDKKKRTIIEEAAPAAEVVTAPADDSELIAVLTAAVAASLQTSTYKLKIMSYRRVDNKRPAWSKAGINENINSRF